jgi:serine O-acetyltransferase
MGVVIGETAEVGDDVTLYQGVTLGGTSLTRGAKRHPTIGNGVIVSSGAQVLGPFRVGDGARIGAQAVVLSEVPEGATMVGIPARPVARRGAPTERKPEFQPYAVCGDIPDPIARALNGLLDEVTNLRARVAEIEQKKAKQMSARDPAAGERPSVRRMAASAGNGADDD